MKVKKIKLGRFITAVQIILSLFFVAVLNKIKVLPTKYNYSITALLLLFCLARIIMELKRGKYKKLFKISNALSVFLSVVLLMSSFYCVNAYSALSKSSGANTKTETISVIALKNSKISNIKDTKEDIFGIRDIINIESTDYAIADINKKLGTEIKTSGYIDFQTQIKALYDSEVDVIILNETYRPIILENFEDFEEKTKVIYTIVRSMPMDIGNSNASIDKPFALYITGIDVYGDISNNSRSDVNILAFVNPQTNKILLVNIPRDYYVKIDGGGGAYDKLTHAGIYGVDCSINTLETLFDVEIDYYVKVNFTSVVNIVNKLGGINVYSEYSFSAGGYSFNEGYQNMSGEKALVFSRERHALPGGDRDRGKNQQAVIDGIINKVTSPAVITNMSGVLNAVSSGVSTNITADEISSLIQQQLTDMSTWTTTSISVDGRGASMPTYSMGSQKLYVMIPDEASVDAAKLAINEILGQTE